MDGKRKRRIRDDARRRWYAFWRQYRWTIHYGAVKLPADYRRLSKRFQSH